jgi:hypothetical protein
MTFFLILQGLAESLSGDSGVRLLDNVGTVQTGALLEMDKMHFSL